MTIIGIQGDKGSANEVACKDFCEKKGISDYKIKYLISTENVLRELNQGKIDLGTFAYKSSRGGLVQETQIAIQKYTFHKIDELDLKIEHALLGIRKLPKNKKALDEKGFKNVGQFLFDHQFSGHCFFAFRYLEYINSGNQSGNVQSIGVYSFCKHNFAKNIVNSDFFGSVGFRRNIHFTSIGRVRVHFKTLELLYGLIVHCYQLLTERK